MRGTSLRGAAWAATAMLLACCALDTEVPPDEQGEPNELNVASGALGGAPEANCTPFENAGRRYWFCTNDRSWDSARALCQGAGYDLASVQTASENSFIKSHLGADAWLAGADTAVEGVWRWNQGNAQFWQGVANGSATAGAFVSWKSGQPNNTSNQDCLMVDDSDGKWSDETCTLTRDYVCEGDECPNDPNKTAPGQCGCGTPDTNSDGDSAADCVDKCPTDAAKTAPGVCGCSAADVDTDGDGTFDCVDQCPSDARYVIPGDCGCGGQAKPAGTVCDDGLCVANTTCDGAGTCGNPQACKPDSDCTLRYLRGVPYWFCDTDRDWDAARLKCQAKGMDLAIIDDAVENAFIDSYTNVDSFIGASDRSVEGTWTWVATQRTFWSGGEAGAPVGGAYTNWEPGDEPDNTPADLDCAAIDDGEWEARVCTTSHDYVCERTDACPNDALKMQPGQCGCGLPDRDEDGDGSADCLDQCPKNATKQAPGACGCGQNDVDTDGDGIANCIDECPASNDATAGGTCGCPGAAAPAGTACNDGICGVGVCDGAGHCGAAATTCSPDPSCSCSVTRIDGTAYWYCPCARTHDAAEASCKSKPGRQLVQIGSAKENTLVAARLTGNAWLGANDRGAEGVWRWSTPQHGDNGPRFWDGAASGGPHFGRYANWTSAEPGGGTGSNCATLSGTSATRGVWSDVSCTSTAHVLCEAGLRRINGSAPVDAPSPCEILGQKCTTARDDVNCVPKSQAFPEPTTAEQVQQMRDCTACVNAHPLDGATVCTTHYPDPNNSSDPIPCSGSATPPPANSTCGSFRDGLPPTHQFLCLLQPNSWANPPVSCETTACTGATCGLSFFCSSCPAGQVCPCKEDTEAECPGVDNLCVSRKVCGTPVEECAQGDVDGDVPCSERELCASGTLEEDLTYDDLRPGTSDLTVVPTTAIEQAFGAPDQPTNALRFPDDPACPGEPNQDNCPSNGSHRWCRYDTPQEVQPRNINPPGRHGDAGDPAKVNFFFTPDIDYGYQVYPGPFGLMQFDVRASASLTAGAEIHVLKANKKLTVVDFLLEAHGGLHDADVDAQDICGISTGNSHLILLERFDILPATFKTSLPNPAAQKACIDGVKEYLAAANRAKKAYSDAKELLRQYKDIRAIGGNFGSGLDGLCDQISSSLPFDFPLGANCLSERPEELLNRFIDYYFMLARDKLANEVAGRVASSIDFAFDQTALGLDLARIRNSEEITLLNTTFPVGPIPVNLQVLMTLGYGLELDGIVKFHPSSLVRSVLFNGATSDSPDDPFAYVGAKATPYANAGLALFVGVGFDIGIAAAKVGIEGSLSLGKVGLPLEAGAGIAVAAEPDKRQVANDLDPDYVLVTDPPLIPAKKYSINAVYKYGAALKLENVLSGSIDVAIKLKFLFFSKKWKAHIVQFKGFCTPANQKPFCNIDIFGGYGTVASIPFEMADWGTALMPTSFLQLKKIPPAQFVAPGSAPFGPGRAGELFYDSLCTCVPRAADVSSGPAPSCHSSSDCCGYEQGDFCFTDPAQGSATVCTTCRGIGESCRDATDCCSAAGGDVTCLDDPGDNVSFGTCRLKSACRGPCSNDDDCNDNTDYQDLFCFTPTVNGMPAPTQRNCRVTANPVETCVTPI